MLSLIFLLILKFHFQPQKIYYWLGCTGEGAWNKGEQEHREEKDMSWGNNLPIKKHNMCGCKSTMALISHPFIFCPLHLIFASLLPTSVFLSQIPSLLQPPLSLSASSLLSRCSKVFLGVWRDSKALVQTGYSSAQGQCTGQGGVGGEGGREQRWTLYSPT